MSTLVLREDRDGLATLTLHRPEKLNALTVALFAELRAHVLQLAQQTEHIGLVVLRGAGKCFSAGHDLADIAHGEKPPQPHFQADTIELLANLPQPVVCAVHGHCYTGALELALAGDMVVAAESAKFADTHARWALTPVWGMSQRLPRRVGMARAQEMTYTARTYSGREAEAMGLVNWCVPDAGFDAAVAGMARGILANSWFSLRANKRLYRETEGLPLRAGLSHEIHRSEGRGPDMDSRIAGFMNKTSKLA
ncbi:MAG: enoyl-CoA hydratase/isomerase family protein [Aquabacterium sp.]|nr:enoyl-CoA hydratase/isomerase family protein [Aquabacterium sp.]